MGEPKLGTGTVLTIVVAAVIGVAGFVYGATGREIAYKVETGLQQDTRLRALEQKSAASEKQYEAISKQLDKIEALIKEYTSR